MKQIILNQVTLCADGSIGLQWMKLVVDTEAKEVLMREPHRSIVEFDGDVDAQMKEVNDHLQTMGYPAVTEAMIGRVRAIDAVGRADPEIEGVRAAKIEAKAELARAAEEAEAAALLAASQQPPAEGQN